MTTKSISIGVRLFCLAACLILGATFTHAAFDLIDNFDGLTPGNVNGQNGWTVVNAGATVATDPEDVLNKVLEVTTTSNRSRKPATLAQGATGTLFFRFRYTGPKNFSIGLSDVAAAGATGNFGDYEAQINVNNQDNRFNVRNGGAFSLTDYITSNVWYNVWMVIDNAADTVRVYRHARPYEPATEADLLRSGAVMDFNFRNGVASSNLVNFLIMTGGAGTGGVEDHTRMWLDDAYLDATSVALDNPTVPVGGSDPIGFVLQPTNIVVGERFAATFMAGVTGAPPRFYQWERNDGSGFTPIPGANALVYTTPVLTPQDHGAQFRVVASNLFSSGTSAAARLTVLTDTNPPVVLRVRSDYPCDKLVITFSEAINASDAVDPFNYSLEGVSFPAIAVFSGSNVVLSLSSPLMVGTTYSLRVSGLRDLAATANLLVETNVVFDTPRLVCGSLRGDYFLSLPSTSVATFTNHPRFPYFYDTTRYFTTFNTGANYSDNYGARLYGLLVPPQTATYVFLVRSDDQSEFYMNTSEFNSEDPAGKVRLAYATAANTGFSTNAFQRSTNYLEAGKRYYLEGVFRDGTGGDYMRVFAIKEGDPFPADGATTGTIPSTSLCAYYDAARITITAQPQGVATLENRLVTLSVGAGIQPADRAINYQWRRDGQAIPGATGPTYTQLLTLADDGARFDAVLSALAADEVTSEPAVMRVGKDSAPPVLLSVASLDGLTIGVCYDELLDTNESGFAPPAIDPFSYSVNGGSVGISHATWGLDHSTVVLHLTAPVADGFTVAIDPALAPIADRAGNAIRGPQTATGRVWGMTALEVGTGGDPLEPGLTFVCDTNRLTLRAGGTDIWGTADHMQFAYVTLDGDFDIKVRVESLLQRDPWSKAGLMARPLADANSRNVAFLVSPATGQNTYTFQWRETDGGASSSFHRGNGGPAVGPVFPHAWVRLQRAGAVFTGSTSTNGMDWTVYRAHDTSTNRDGAFPSSLLVGLSATSHNNAAGQATDAVFRDLSIVPLGVIPPKFQSVTYAGGNVMLAFPTQAGVSYALEYKRTLSDPSWLPLATLPGNGQVQTYIDGNPSDRSRFYRLRAQ